MDHAVSAAADHDVGIAAAEDFGGFADGLRAGGAGGEAIHRGAASAGEECQMGQRHVRLLLELADDVHAFEGDLGPFHGVDGGSVGFPGGEGGACVCVEIERAFAAAEVDSDAVEVESCLVQAGCLPGLLAGAEGELGIAASAGVRVRCRR